MTNLTDYKAYRRDLREWNAECERQKVEFTITEHDLHADRRLPDFDPEVREWGEIGS